MAQTNLPTWAAKALAAMKGDAKKTGALIVLIVLLGFMCIRMMGPGKRRTLSAAGAVIGSIVNAKPGKSDHPQQTARLSAANPRLQAWAEQDLTPITRNLFAVRLEFFPAEGPRNARGVEQQDDQGFWGRLEKSLILQADQRDKRENQIAHYKVEAAQLKLQSTMMGEHPKAMVNGELVGEGDVVASFRVLKIEARRIVIEREGIRLEIQMK